MRRSCKRVACLAKRKFEQEGAESLARPAAATKNRMATLGASGLPREVKTRRQAHDSIFRRQVELCQSQPLIAAHSARATAGLPSSEVTLPTDRFGLLQRVEVGKTPCPQRRKRVWQSGLAECQRNKAHRVKRTATRLHCWASQQWHARSAVLPTVGLAEFDP